LFFIKLPVEPANAVKVLAILTFAILLNKSTQSSEKTKNKKVSK
jgi:hypothetical protein